MKAKRWCLGLLAAVWAGWAWPGWAVDNPPASQGVGEHSTIVTSTGRMRDDELAKMIKDAIDAAPNKPTSVKVFFNSCYGGGMLDDIAKMLGTYDPPIPFVGGAASDANQPAWGPPNSWVGDTNLGSFWTNELAGAMGGGATGTVSGTIATANANDPTAPGGSLTNRLPKGGVPENPQNTSAHGGSSVNWGPGESVVFSGNNSHDRHDNNVENMENAFLGTFGQVFSSSLNGSSKAALQGMIQAACNSLDGGEELVLYVDDHGNTEFDLDEWVAHYTGGGGIMIDPITGWKSEAPDGSWPVLHDGWLMGLSLNVAQGDPVNPGIFMTAADDPAFWSDYPEGYPVDSFFDVFFNDVPLPGLPELLFPGVEVFIPAPWPLFAPGPVLLEFVPTGSLPGLPLPLANLELSSGPINDLEVVPEPAAWALLTAMALLLPHRRTGAGGGGEGRPAIG